MAARFAFSGLQLLSASGKPLSAGKIDFWANGTTTDQDTFTAVGLGVANANPLILDANGRVPEAWSNDSDVYSWRLSDADDNVIIATIDDYSFIGSFSLTAADVLAVLNGNSTAVVIDGPSMDGTSFANFITAFTLSAAGTIDSSAGTITVGAISGTPVFAGGATFGSDVVSDTDSTDDLGTTGVRWANLFVDAITLTGGTGSFTVDDTKNTGIADAYGQITGTTTVTGVGIASVSNSGTGVNVVVFDNAADTTNEQVIVATTGGAGNNNVDAVRQSTSEATVRTFDADAGTATATYPVHIVRYLYT